MAEDQSVLELSAVKKILEEDIKRLKIERDNVESQSHTATLKKESLDKLNKAKSQTEINKALTDINLLRSKLSMQLSAVEDEHEKLNNRRIDLEKREKEVVDLDKHIREAYNERHAIYKLRIDANKMIDRAKTLMAEAEEKMKSVDSEKQDIELRKKELANKEKMQNDLIGKLEERDRKLDSFERDLIALEAKLKEREENNGKKT